MNLAELLVASARREPGRTAIVSDGADISYGELRSEAARVAGALTELGVEKGDRVAIWLPNHPRFISILYGVWGAGAVVVPVHAMLTAGETRHILSNSGAKVLFCAQPHYALVPELRSAVATLGHVVVLEQEAAGDDKTYGQWIQDADEAAPAPREPEDLALIAYTSGTSGLPKGAMLGHGALNANIEQMKQIPVATTYEDRVLSILPLFHIYGLTVVVNLSVAAGATIVLQDRFDPVGSVRAIREHQVTVVAAAPPAYLAWLAEPSATAQDWSSVRIAISGAAPLPREALTGFQERFGVTIWEGYGLTETAPTLTSTSVGGQAKPSSVGRAIPGVEMRLIAADGLEAEEGDPGEIVVRGPNLFQGYWEDPGATSVALADGWFRTGDVAIRDDDGDLYIVDRKRDLILVSGFNVYPKEVEEALASHPHVAETAVVGVPDEYHGEAVKAIVVRAPGAQLEAEELLEHARTHLAPYKVPSVVEFTEQIPRNAAGKVLRRTLR